MMQNATIKITQRMLNKSIIDANKSVVAFAKEHLTTDYDMIENGQKATFTGFFTDDFRSQETQVRLYRRPRGDKLLSIKHLSKWAKAGDTVVLKSEVALHPDSNYFVIRINVRKGETV